MALLPAYTDIVHYRDGWRSQGMHTPMSLLIIPIFFVSALTYGLTGFGSALIAMPLLSPLIGVEVAAPLFALVAVVAEVVSFLRYRRHLEFQSVRRLIIGSLIAIPIGIALASRLPERWVLLALGVGVIGYSLYSLLRLPLPHINQPRLGYAFGFLGGLFSGAYNIGGPAIVIYGNLSRWNPGAFKSGLQSFFMLNSALVVTLHLLNQHVTPLVWEGVLLALPTMLLGTWLGWKLEARINPAQFQRLVLILLVLIGARLVLANLIGT